MELKGFRDESEPQNSQLGAFLDQEKGSFSHLLCGQLLEVG